MTGASADPRRVVVIDARPATPQIDGLGTYIREILPRLIPALPNARVRVLSLPSMADYWRSTLVGCEIEAVDCRPIWPRQQIDIPLLLRRDKIDLYFYPAHDPPVAVNGRLVFSVMDVTQLQVPNFHERHNLLKTTYVREILRIAVRRAAAVFAISEWTRQSVGRIVGRRYLDRIHVTPLASRRTEIHRSAAPRHFLYIGTDRPHKNLDRLLAGYAEARRRCASVPPLVIAGQTRRPEHLRQLAGDLGISPNVSFRGYVSDEDADKLYGDAAALVLVSLGEGFGLPILEAMSHGIPVVTSQTSAMSEVAGDAALLVDPEDVSSIAAGLARVACDPDLRADLARRGPARAALFTWDRCAALTANVLNSVFGERCQ